MHADHIGTKTRKSISITTSGDLQEPQDPGRAPTSPQASRPSGCPAVSHRRRGARTEGRPEEPRTALTGPVRRGETGSRRPHKAPAAPEEKGSPSAPLPAPRPTPPACPGTTYPKTPPSLQHERRRAPPTPRRRRQARPRLYGAGRKAGGAAPRVPAPAPGPAGLCPLGAQGRGLRRGPTANTPRPKTEEELFLFCLRIFRVRSGHLLTVLPLSESLASFFFLQIKA